MVRMDSVGGLLAGSMVWSMLRLGFSSGKNKHWQGRAWRWQDAVVHFSARTFTSASRWTAFMGCQIDRIRINTLSRDTVEGVPVWVKKRTPVSHWLVRVANGFFQLAHNPVEVLATGEHWRRWEVEMFMALHGGNRLAGVAGDGAVYAEILPGADLVQFLKENRLNAAVLGLAGDAFRQMHAKRDPLSGDYFSHGDPHLGNVIIDEKCARSGWIDFETRHTGGLSAGELHADDLLVFLLDLAGRSTREEWEWRSRAFLDGYGRAEVLHFLKKRLTLPAGWGAVWCGGRCARAI